MKVQAEKYKRQGGLSLVELLVSIFLGMLLLFGVFQIFDSNQQSARMTNSFSRVQEGGRISLELIARDIRMTDYWGCTIKPSDVEVHLLTSDSDYNPVMNPTVGEVISGQDDVGSSVVIGSIAVKENTDILHLKGARRVSSARIVPPYVSEGSTTIHITPGVTLVENGVYLISDCNGGDLFTNTSTTAGEVHYGVATIAGAPDNDAIDISQDYTAHAQLLTPWTRSYFIGQPSAGVWSLYWQGNGTNPEELVRDVEDMQVEYGEDTTGDGSVDVFRAAGSVLNWSEVISVRVVLTVASTNSSDGAAMSRDYSVTGNIRNRSL